jgi:hypothetical protein
LGVKNGGTKTPEIGIPQDAAQATRAPRLAKQGGVVDWSQPAAELERPPLVTAGRRGASVRAASASRGKPCDRGDHGRTGRWTAEVNGRTLSAGRSGSPPDICRAVATLPGLRSLHLIDVPIGDEGLGVLAGLPGLWNLHLDGAGVSNEAWGKYFQKRPKVHVHVDQAHHDRDPNSHDH